MYRPWEVDDERGTLLLDALYAPPPPWGVCATGTGYDTTLGQHSRLQSIPPVHPAHRDGAIGMDPHRHPEDGCTSPPPYLGHAIPPPSQRGWTGTEASVLFGWDGNGNPYLLGWTAGSIPASIPSLWDGECSPSPPPSRRPPSLLGGMESGFPLPRAALGTERDGMHRCPRRALCHRSQTPHEHFRVEGCGAKASDTPASTSVGAASPSQPQSPADRRTDRRAAAMNGAGFSKVRNINSQVLPCRQDSHLKMLGNHRRAPLCSAKFALPPRHPFFRCLVFSGIDLSNHCPENTANRGVYYY